MTKRKKRASLAGLLKTLDNTRDKAADWNLTSMIVSVSDYDRYLRPILVNAIAKLGGGK